MRWSCGTLRTWLIGLLILGPAMALAGCIASDDDETLGADSVPAVPGPAVVVIEDAAGDARVMNRDLVQRRVQAQCGPVRIASQEAWETCRDTVGTAGSGVPNEGLPAPPVLDLLGVSMAETPRDLIVTIDVASIDDGLQETLAEPGDHVFYTVCWMPSGEECVYLDGYNAYGTIVIESSYDVYSPHCNDWWWCSWRVQQEILPGSPGQLRLTIPRAILPNGTAGDTLADIQAASWAYVEGGDGLTALHVSAPVNRWVPVYGPANYRADDAYGTAGYRFETPMATPRRSATPVLQWPDSTGDATGPETDILEVRLVEKPDAFLLAVKVAEVREDPTPHIFDSEIGLPVGGIPGGRVYEAWYDIQDGKRVVGAGYCQGPQENPCERWLTFDPPLALATGTPGWINLTYPRLDLGSPVAGTMLNIVSVDLVARDVHADPSAGPVRFELFTQSSGDWAATGPPYWLHMDTEVPTGDGARTGLVAEGPGDVQRPQVWLDPAADARFDLTFVDAVRMRDQLRVTLGVADLTTTAPPPPYDAVLYGVAVDPGHGPVLLGYYRDNQNPAQFFCGQDTLLFASDKSDPTGSVTPITGTVAAARRSDDERRTDSAGTISFFAPLECFGLASGDSFENAELAAGAWVFQNPSGRPGQGTPSPPLDDAYAPGPVTIPREEMLTTAGTGTATWYERPFGISEFWNIAGIVGAVGVGGAGVAAVRRKRSILRQYLAEVDHAAAITAPERREAALRDIQRTLKEDLVSGHLSEGHYVIVERRLEQQLSKTRLAAVVEVFDDLPHRLLGRLQEMLADGQMSASDFRLFSSLLEDTGLSKDAKARVRRKLKAWVREDAA